MTWLLTEAVCVGPEGKRVDRVGIIITSNICICNWKNKKQQQWTAFSVNAFLLYLLQEVLEHMWLSKFLFVIVTDPILDDVIKI